MLIALKSFDGPDMFNKDSVIASFEKKIFDLSTNNFF